MNNEGQPNKYYLAYQKDSGIYGQVIYSLESDSPHDLDLFSVSTVNRKAELKLIGDLDFESEQLHQLRIVAKDRANFGRVNSATTGKKILLDCQLKIYELNI